MYIHINIYTCSLPAEHSRSSASTLSSARGTGLFPSDELRYLDLRQKSRGFASDAQITSWLNYLVNCLSLNYLLN